MNELENVADKLKRTQEELGRHSKMALARTVKASVLSLVFGMALGAFGMVYFEQQKPVITVEHDSIIQNNVLTGFEGKMGPVVKDARDRRVKELRFSLQKLERLKDVHDATLKEAATNQGDIRQMVKALEVGK